ncbi:hypothetical protein ACFOGG_11810 [Brenneria rubrifaciens]|uniref:hypothetical protein n=1 Tax=Brenneria rubrifaciens TaxID=55213 RepID=UPI00362239B1
MPHRRPRPTKDSIHHARNNEVWDAAKILRGMVGAKAGAEGDQQRTGKESRLSDRRRVSYCCLI